MFGGSEGDGVGAEVVEAEGDQAEVVEHYLLQDAADV
jgi:hypothetical protein